MFVTERMIALALNDYLEWVRLGANKDEVFRRIRALCFNVASHIRKVQGVDVLNTEVMHKMGRMFVADGLHKAYPFGGEALYDREHELGSYHLNLDRLEWARKFVAQHV